ncbi:hypothetical protein Poli38472_002342 [Pythium oligandrum]|uniref:Uncharacterized protein n=1 Tax=Pythium oligandrum TaxID=41045 RepID=A0A8K1CII9_PYTOL|nr:hypothetical protein Poli38472_002342 [Pythium oligandrum]|eukprot:TMW63401.1 hypothetical protein Poli38472_002342 [Pythium oligandrum]
MARGSGGGGKASNGKELKMFLKNGWWKEHWYLIFAVLGISIGVFGTIIIEALRAKQEIFSIDVTDQVLMTRVFRSGEPWMVLCSKPDDILPEVFTKAAPRLVGEAYVGVIDCTQKMPKTGKSILARYGIKSVIQPTIFTIADHQKPKQIFLDDLQSARDLAHKAMSQTRRALVQVLNAAELEAKCLNKAKCVLFLRSGKFKQYERRWIDRMVRKQRAVQFAWIDSTVSKLSIEYMLPEYALGEHRVVFFKKQRDPEKKKRSIVTAKAYRNIFDDVPVRQFVDDNLEATLKPLSKSIKVSRRKSILETAREEARKANDESYVEKRRRERKEEEANADDAHFFPQAADEEQGEVADISNIEEEDEEVIDLDAAAHSDEL